jgi:hypothetical protein
VSDHASDSPWPMSAASMRASYAALRAPVDASAAWSDDCIDCLEELIGGLIDGDRREERMSLVRAVPVCDRTSLPLAPSLRSRTLIPDHLLSRRSRRLRSSHQASRRRRRTLRSRASARCALRRPITIIRYTHRLVPSRLLPLISPPFVSSTPIASDLI